MPSLVRQCLLSSFSLYCSQKHHTCARVSLFQQQQQRDKQHYFTFSIGTKIVSSVREVCVESSARIA